MRLGAMLGDVLRGLVREPITQKYPFVRIEAPKELRSKLTWTSKGCTGCQLCVKDCPSKAIELITIDKAAKRFAVQYHVDRCTFCAQCVQSCRFKCLNLSGGWELASLTKQPFEVYYGADDDAAKSAMAASIDGNTVAPEKA